MITDLTPYQFTFGTLERICPPRAMEGGYLYAMLDSRCVKVGSSIDPRSRLPAQLAYMGRESESLVVFVGRNFRQLEKAIHAVLKPINRRYKLDGKNEYYPVKNPYFRAAIRDCLIHKASADKIQLLQSWAEHIYDCSARCKCSHGVNVVEDYQI